MFIRWLICSNLSLLSCWFKPVTSCLNTTASCAINASWWTHLVDFILQFGLWVLICWATIIPICALLLLLLLAVIFTTHLHQSELPFLSVFFILSDLAFAFSRLKRSNCSLFLVLIRKLFLLYYVIEAVWSIRSVGWLICLLWVMTVVVLRAL